MIRSTVARVDLAALEIQLRGDSKLRIGRAVEHLTAIIGVVKANAYGHGAPRVALALQEAGATMLACADIEEASCSGRLMRVPILVFGALSVSDLDGLFDFELTPTSRRRGRACAVQAAAAPFNDVLPPEDRHRHEPARVSSRQPASDASSCWPARTDSTPSTHFLCRRARESGLQ